ncbi:probable cytochrome P450 49a1 [Saccostrea echinata]|uniref:probable cytochrome P450 49a1 n=1 Tax=Saccostrea echinata TaxID=191078 RepID=UPI002A813313|nr:probable cytochrome P450 49a1 [Saccostrea echinata]
MKLRGRCMLRLTEHHPFITTTTTYLKNQSTSTVAEIQGFQNEELLSETNSRPFEEIPGPSGIYQLPYLGLILQMRPFTNYAKDNMQQRVLSWTKTYGPICKQKLGNDWYVFLADPRDVEKVFRNDRQYPYRGILPLTKVYTKRTRTKPGLTALNDEEWFALRKTAQRAILRRKSVNKYLPAISAIADDFVNKFRRKDRIDDVIQHLMEFSTEGAGKMCFGVRLGCISSPDQTIKTETMQHVETFLDCFGNQFYIMPWYKLFQTPFYRKYAKSANYLRRQTQKYIAKHKERIQSHNAEVIDPSLLGDMLSDPHMTTADITKTLMDVFIGGIDSTAANMTTLLYNLAKNPEKQDKLFEELETYVSKSGPIDETVFRHLNYLKACLKESFRLVFPVPVGTARSLDKDITIKGFRIPAFTNIVFCSGITCQDSKYFEKPEAFIPERWLRVSDKYSPTHSFAHIPFGYGPRKCIGQTFAETEIYICTAKLLRNFRLTLPQETSKIIYKDKTFRTPVTPVSFIVKSR